MQIVSSVNILSILIWLPIISGFAVMLIDRSQWKQWVQPFSMVVGVVCFLLSLGLWHDFNPQMVDFQFVEHYAWLPGFDIYYHLGIDGFSLPLIVLTCFFSPIITLSAWRVIQNQAAMYYACFLMMQGVMCGVFMALDSIVFYLFWEAMLIPMFLIIGIWGGANKVYAAMKFFLYTFFGSLFLLLAIIYLHLQAVDQALLGSFDILTFHKLTLSAEAQMWLFAAMVLAFAIKIPMWPVHTWLPDAHVQAPTGGSVILAAIMLKLGGYGFLRFVLPITPQAALDYGWVIIGLSLIAVVYIGFVALVQSDMKKLIAYSSIAHMGFVTLGFIGAVLLTSQQSMDAAMLGITGAYVQMISHGFISGAMFLCIGVLYDRMHSREIGDYGGVVNVMPLYAAFAVLFAMANAGLPGTSGFVGEFMVILSIFQVNVWYAILAATTLILGAAYTLWMVKRVIFGDITNRMVAELKDVNGHEFIYLSILAFFVILFGVWPQPIIDVTNTATSTLLTAMQS